MMLFPTIGQLLRWCVLPAGYVSGGFAIQECEFQKQRLSTDTWLCIVVGCCPCDLACHGMIKTRTVGAPFFLAVDKAACAALLPLLHAIFWVHWFGFEGRLFKQFWSAVWEFRAHCMSQHTPEHAGKVRSDGRTNMQTCMHERICWPGETHPLLPHPSSCTERPTNGNASWGDAKAWRWVGRMRCHLEQNGLTRRAMILHCHGTEGRLAIEAQHDGGRLDSEQEAGITLGDHRLARRNAQESEILGRQIATGRTKEHCYSCMFL